MLRKISISLLALIMLASICICSVSPIADSVFNNADIVYAEQDGSEGNEGGSSTENGGNGEDPMEGTTPSQPVITTPKLTGDPKQILSDPNFDLNTVDPAVLKAWYESAVNIPDAALNKALQDATGLSTVTVESMLGLSGTVNLTNMGITTLTGMEYAINAKRILLSNNTVVSLDQLKNLSHLEYLDYSNNSVKMVPSWIFTLPNLTFVNGSNNASTAMQQASTASSALKELYLENNALTSIPDISFCSEMTSLSFTNNALAAFPTTILSLPKLSTLYLSGNKITEVPNLSSLGNLTVLNVEKNFLTAFPEGLENMANLKQLSLSCNAITSIPDAIANMPNLTTLIIYGNAITVLPESLNSSKLTVLDIGLNDIDLSANEAMIKSLTDKLDSFYYKLQKPNFKLTLVEDKAAPGGKLVWTGVGDMKEDNEGYYSVTKIVIERKEETITEEDKKEPSADGNNTDAATDNTNTTTTDDDNSDIINNDAKPVITVFEQIAELEPGKSEYIDEKADAKTNYTYRVTVYIHGKYMDNYEFDINGSKTINTKDMIKQSNTKLILFIVGGVLLVALIAGGVVFFLKRRQKDGNKTSKTGAPLKKKNGKKIVKTKKKKNDVETDVDEVVSEDLSAEDPIESIDDIKRILAERQKNAEQSEAQTVSDEPVEAKKNENKPAKKVKKHKSIISDWDDDDDIEAELNKIIYNDSDDEYK